ncbi:MAG: GNAT family protein [Actinomycetota bacterium]
MDCELRDREVLLRPAMEDDLEPLWHLIHDDLAWKRFDAPYYPPPNWTLEEFRTGYFQVLSDGDRALVVEVNGEPVGVVTYTWEDEATRWLEVGIVLYSPDSWGRHLGRRALRLWVSHLFSRFEIEHIGLTTWSGNPRMIGCAESLGMKLEARVRKVRYFEGEYFDSIKLGVLRQEWQPDS